MNGSGKDSRKGHYPRRNAVDLSGRPAASESASPGLAAGVASVMETRRPEGPGQRRLAGSVRSMTERPEGRRPARELMPLAVKTWSKETK